MELNNYSQYQAAYSTGLLSGGQYCVVVVIKAGFDLPSSPAVDPTLCRHECEIYSSDQFTGDPGYSSPIIENDFAAEKPRCDVIVQNPVVYAPQGQATGRVEVGLQIGTINKRFAVMGSRYWQVTGPFISPSQPKPFTRLPLNWELAYGGVDHTAYEEEAFSDSCRPNPVGTGYWHKPQAKQVKDTAIAQTEALDQPISKPGKHYDPQGFGPIARNWLPRSEYGGTYDDHWLRHCKPFLPDDFNPLYYQCAPVDQQMDYPQGGETLILTNLTAQGEWQCTLPKLAVPVKATSRTGQVQAVTMNIDTVTVNPEAGQLHLVARGVVPFVHAIHEIQQIDIGDAHSGHLKVTTAPCRSCS